MQKHIFHLPAKFESFIPVIVAVLSISSCEVGRWKAFDVAYSSMDRNGFPLNPRWGQQARDNTLPAPRASCPLDSEDPHLWTSSPQFPDCTSLQVTFNNGFWCGRHVNFMPVTYEGRVTWNQVGEPAPFGDQDYTLDVVRDDSALFSMAGHHVHIEFDSRETVNLWDNTDTWWHKFHDAVDTGQAHAMIDSRRVIVIGVLGMDTYQGPGHGPEGKGKTELHPVYAMLVLWDQKPWLNQETWAYFVRNWGNEGYCGEGQVNLLPPNTIWVQIPDAVAILSPYGWHGARNTNDLSPMSISVEPNPAGIQVGFNLLPAEKQSWFVGDLVVQKRARGPSTPPVLQRAPVSEESLPEFAELRLQLDKLPESARRELLARQKSADVRMPGSRLPLRTFAESTEARVSHLKSPVSVERRLSMQRDTVGEMNRRKELEVLRRFLSERGIHLEVPTKPVSVP